MLYVQLKKTLYGTLQAALLFWQLLSKTLMEWVFKLNEDDPCVANKIINGTQCTIVWHVDDLKILHVEKKVMERVISDLSKVFRQEISLMTTRSKVLEYLGMTLDYTSKGKVKFSMHEYIDAGRLALGYERTVQDACSITFVQ